MSPPNLAAAAEAPWMVLARRELGVAEAPGAADNDRVLAYYSDADHPEIAHDSVAWCAAFACAMLERSGTRSPRTLRAREFLEWGDPVETPRRGCIVVLWRGQPDGAEGHVGFYAGSKGEAVLILGGNQGDKVSIAAFRQNQVLGYRWPAAAEPDDEPAAVVPPASVPMPVPADGTFDGALAHVLAQEGGWSDDPVDPGGPTNKGITLAELARWDSVELNPETLADERERLRSIDTATVRRIYDANYWQPARCPDLPAAIAFVHFDTAVNQGVGRAARLLQAALEVEVDGEIGPITLAAATQADPATLIEAYCARRRDHYRGLPHFWRFGRGWLARVEATRAAAMRLIDQAPSTPRQEPTPMPTPPNAPQPQSTKWWGHSMTIWGVVVTSLTTVLPLVARGLGIDLPADLLADLGSQLTTLFQAIGGLAGTVITIAGRARARQPLDLSATPPTLPPFGPRDWRRGG